MYPYCVFLDAVTLRRLYLDETRSMVDIARLVGCSPSTVRRQLIRFRIPTRRRGPAPGALRVARGAQFQGWSADIAYVVGLLATDGNLGRKTAAISIVSKDVDLLETVQHCLGLPNPIKPHRGGYSHRCHHLAWGDRKFYDWLRSVGLTPAKSLTLGALAIPDEYFADFFRGCIDGDGSVVTYTDRYHVFKNEGYVYDRLYVSIVSASRVFIEWLHSTVSRLIGVTGSVSVRRQNGKNPMWTLRYAKAQSLRILRWMYYSADVPCLQRKRIKAERFLTPLGYATARPTGRPRVGWIYDVQTDITGRVEEHTPAWFHFGFTPRILESGACRNPADDADSKSAARKGVGVQIPSPPPLPFLTASSPRLYRDTSRGAVAQLGEHKAGSLGVRGSNPLSSTIY
jgi:hypothetical protein